MSRSCIADEGGSRNDLSRFMRPHPKCAPRAAFGDVGACWNQSTIPPRCALPATARNAPWGPPNRRFLNRVQSEMRSLHFVLGFGGVHRHCWRRGLNFIFFNLLNRDSADACHGCQGRSKSKNFAYRARRGLGSITARATSCRAGERSEGRDGRRHRPLASRGSPPSR